MSLEYKFENRGTVNVRPTGSDKPCTCWYIFAGVAAVVLIAGLWLFFSGYLMPVNSTGAQAMTLRGKMDEQERQLEQRATGLRGLEDQLASSKRGEQVQTAANDELRKKLAVLEAEMATEREKLVLYEGILAPADLEPGLHIQHFGLKKSLVDGDGKKVGARELYHYHLVLAHIRGGDVTLDGHYSLVISGKQAGKPISFTQKDGSPEGEKPVDSFAVKYYQSLEGNIMLPKEFMPESVTVKVSPSSGETPDRLTKSYDWATFNESNASTKKE